MKLGDVTRQVRDSFSVQQEESYVSLGLRMYGHGVFARPEKPGKDIKGKTLFRVQAGQFIYNRMFASGGSFGLVPKDMAHGVVSNEFPVFETDRSRLLPQYLNLYFTRPEIWSAIETECTGTTKSRLRWKESNFANFPIILPPLGEQERIVDLIGSLDDAIEAAEGAVGAAAALFDSLIERLVVGAHGESAQLADVAVLHYGKPMRERDRIAGSIPVVGSSGIFGRHAESNVSTSYSIVVGRKGTAGSVTWFNQPVWATDTSYWVEPKTEVDAKFLYLALVGSRLSELSAQTGVPGLNRDRAYSARITLPPLAEQKRVASLMTSLECAQEDRRRHADALRSLRSELLNALLSGAHAIPATYDQPVLPAAA